MGYEEHFDKVFPQEVESNWKYLFKYYSITPILSGFANDLDTFKIESSPFYVSGYFTESTYKNTKTDVNFGDVNDVLTALALEGTNNNVNFSELVNTRKYTNTFQEKWKNINLSSVYVGARMDHNRKSYKLIRELIVMSTEFLKKLATVANIHISGMIYEIMDNSQFFKKSDSNVRKYVGIDRATYNTLIYLVNEQLVTLYQCLHLWEIDDLYDAILNTDQFLERVKYDFSDDAMYKIVELYIRTFRPYYVRLYEMLVHNGNSWVLGNLRSNEEVFGEILKEIGSWSQNGNEHMLTVGGFHPEYQPFPYPTSIQSFPFYITRLHIPKQNGGTNEHGYV